MVNDPGASPGSTAAGVSMAIGWSAVSSTCSAFFRFGGFFFAFQLVLLLLLPRGADEECGMGVERDSASLYLVVGCDGSLPGCKHTADTDVPFMGSSTFPWTTSVRAVVKFAVSRCKGLTEKLISWGGVGGGSSPGSIISSWGV